MDSTKSVSVHRVDPRTVRKQFLCHFGASRIQQGGGAAHKKVVSSNQGDRSALVLVDVYISTSVKQDA